MGNSTLQEKWLAGLQSALIAKWAIGWSAISALLGNAFLQGEFASPKLTSAYFVENWWTLIISGVFAIIVGGAVRGQTKANYIGRVESGTAIPPPNPVIVPPATQVIAPKGDPPSVNPP